MRLIDADDFGNRMYHEAFEKDSDLQKWDSGCWIRYKLFENVLREQPTIQPVANDTNVGDTISRKGVFIPNITVEMFRNASLEGVEDLMASGEMEDVSLPSAQREPKKGEWLRYGEDGYPNNEDTVFWQCDQCLEQYTGRTKRIPNFCPNCGADMRGEQG